MRRGRGRELERADMLIHGRCHCGNIAFALTWEPDPVEIPARACTCSFCVKHGGVWTSYPSGALAVVNVNSFEGVDPSLLRRASANLDGEGTDSRLARRKRNWIARVESVERR